MTHDDPHSQAADAVHEGRPVEAQYVRQGRPGVRILWLLIISAGAAAVLLIGMWLVSNNGFQTVNPTAGEEAAQSQAFDGDGQTPPAADAPTTATGQPTNPPTGEAPNVNAPTVSATPSSQP